MSTHLPPSLALWLVSCSYYLSPSVLIKSIYVSSYSRVRSAGATRDGGYRQAVPHGAAPGRGSAAEVLLHLCPGELPLSARERSELPGQGLHRKERAGAVGVQGAFWAIVQNVGFRRRIWAPSALYAEGSTLLSE